MGNRLVDSVNSQYVAAANRLRGDKRERVIAYVESYDDIAFWRLLLEEYETPKRYFQIMLPSRTNLTKGKRSAIRSSIQDTSLGENMIACVDSDYDYLLQGATQLSKEILENPYIIHTYAYAIENYKCYASSLHQIMVQVTLNDRRIVDYEQFMELYSQTIHPLFLWNVWFYRQGWHNRYSMQDFCRDILIRSINVENPYSVIALLATRVKRKVESFEKRYQQNVGELMQLRDELRLLGVEESNCYLFIRGHFLMDCIMAKLLRPICSALISEREAEIFNNALHREQMNNELSAYRHSQMSIVDALRKNTHYRECGLYSMIRADMDRLVAIMNSGELSLLPEGGHKDDEDGKDFQSSH